LDLAASDQGAFRGVVGALSESQKGFMEVVILKGREASAAGKTAEGEGASGEPSIALRMDFGV
jgi:hypothetical protein